MQKDRGPASILIGLLLLISFLLVPLSGSALATCFSGEQAIFVRDTDKYHAYGTTNEFLLNVRDLAQACSNPLASTTAHMEPGPTPGELDEVGWDEYPCSSDPSGVCFRVFTEGTYKGILRCGPTFQFDKDARLKRGEFQNWRVENITINGNNLYWGFRVNFEDGGGWHAIGHCLGQADHGKARGETVRLGGTGTGMSTTAQNLNFKGSGGAWNPWPGTVCDDDPVDGWEVNVTSSNSYRIRAGTGNCQFSPP
jgi:hypothetical protein